MSNCFSCGKAFNGSVNDLLQLYKKAYLERGIERYFYKLSTKGDVLTVNKKYFNIVFERDIKPNFINGAEYAHIKEYATI